MQLLSTDPFVKRYSTKSTLMESATTSERKSCTGMLITTAEELSLLEGRIIRREEEGIGLGKGLGLAKGVRGGIGIRVWLGLSE